MTADDIAGYTVLEQAPTHIEYRGLDVYGMAPSSSGGTTVGESLNILENFDLSAENTPQSLHLLLRGDRPRVRRPQQRTWAIRRSSTCRPRRCSARSSPTPGPARSIRTTASPKPVAGRATLDAAGCEAAAAAEAADTENISTTHLSVVDKWGNAVAYTLTIEQTGGSGMTVPGRGFLLNNELTDFNFAPTSTLYPDPNLVEPGKRPRSSMSPTIVLDDGNVRYVVGSPGGATIITTVTQVLMNRIDLGMTLPEAVAAPRASQRNAQVTAVEPAFLTAYGAQLTPYGHTFGVPAEIGAVAAIEVDADGLMTAVAEPVRRGGGTGLVVEPAG